VAAEILARLNSRDAKPLQDVRETLSVGFHRGVCRVA
jgi:hypothetical protein